MVKLQIDLPKYLEKAIAVYSIEQDLRDKRKAIIKILLEYFKLKEPIKVE